MMLNFHRFPSFKIISVVTDKNIITVHSLVKLVLVDHLMKVFLLIFIYVHAVPAIF